MKKIICILTLVCVAVSFAACKAETENKVTTETQSTTLEVETEPTTEGTTSAEISTSKGEKVTVGAVEKSEKLTLGEISESGYENKSAGLKIENLGDGWKEEEPKQIATAFDSGIDEETGKALYSISEDASLYYLCDVMYVNQNDDSVVSVSLLKNEKGKDLSKIVLEEEGSQDVKGYDAKEELIYLNIAGKKAACKKTVYERSTDIVKLPNVNEYDVFFLSKDKKQAVKVVIVCFDGKTDVNKILEHFKDF